MNRVLRVERKDRLSHQDTKDTKLHKEILVNLSVLCALVAEKYSLINILFTQYPEFVLVVWTDDSAVLYPKMKIR